MVSTKSSAASPLVPRKLDTISDDVDVDVDEQEQADHTRSDSDDIAFK